MDDKRGQRRREKGQRRREKAFYIFLTIYGGAVGALVFEVVKGFNEILSLDVGTHLNVWMFLNLLNLFNLAMVALIGVLIYYYIYPLFCPHDFPDDHPLTVSIKTYGKKFQNFRKKIKVLARRIFSGIFPASR